MNANLVICECPQVDLKKHKLANEYIMSLSYINEKDRTKINVFTFLREMKCKNMNIEFVYNIGDIGHIKPLYYEITSVSNFPLLQNNNINVHLYSSGKKSFGHSALSQGKAVPFILSRIKDISLQQQHYNLLDSYKVELLATSNEVTISVDDNTVDNLYAFYLLDNNRSQYQNDVYKSKYKHNNQYSFKILDKYEYPSFVKVYLKNIKGQIYLTFRR